MTLKTGINVLYYTNADVKDRYLVPSIIESTGDFVKITTGKPVISDILESGIEFIVCDRARALITDDILCCLPNAVINIHPSYLPWNRGYFPNFWSHFTGTPSGVTIHYVDSGIDTGKILAQTRVAHAASETLRSTYNRLRRISVNLFEEMWPAIRTREIAGVPQDDRLDSKTYLKADFGGLFEQLPNGWDTPISVVRGMNLKT